MGVDVPQMTETYETNMDEQMEKAVDFEREIKEIITQYEIQCATQDHKSANSDGFTTPNLSEGSGQPEPKRSKGPDRRRSDDTGMPDVSRLNLNIPVPPYPPLPRPDRTDSVVRPATLNVPCLLYTSPSPRDRG